MLGVLPGIIGSLQAMEAIKLILGIGQVPLGKLTIYEALGTTFRTITLRRDSTCKLCGDSPEITSVVNAETTAPPTCDILDPSMESITTTELRDVLSQGFQGLLIDVREPEEHAVARINGSRLIPLKTLPDLLSSLPRDQQILVHCKAGGRSAKAVRLLLDNGFSRVKNVAGGMDSWLAEN